MADYTERDISYIDGEIEEILIGIARHTPKDNNFDHDRWESLYGETVTYSSFPAYPDEEARAENEKASSILDWDAETETPYLEAGAEVPNDRLARLSSGIELL